MIGNKEANEKVKNKEPKEERIDSKQKRQHETQQ